MEANTGVLKDLANRESALTQKVESAESEAQKIIADAELRARDIMAKAQGEAVTLEAEYKARREAEGKTILESGVAAARSTADAAKAAAQGKIADAVKAIVSRVLP